MIKHSQFLVSILVSTLLFANCASAQSKAKRAPAVPAHIGDFAALERITLENIIFKVKANKKIDFSYLTIAMNCTSVDDGLQYERSFLLADEQVRPFNFRKTATGKIVANKNFSEISAVGPRTGQVDITMNFRGRAWSVNVQVQAVATDEGSTNIVENCVGNTIFSATKKPRNDFGAP